MGGNALKVPTRRYEKDEYLKIMSDVLRMLANYDIEAVIPDSYSNKETFGDLDVLIKSSTIKTDIMEVINYLFNPNEIYNNNNVKSFDFREFQIDFILVGDENWVTSINYFSFNDLGNFIGRISYQMGFRFGDYGLKLVYRHEDGGRKFSKIISKKPHKIYEFLGFDYEKYLEGFDEVEDIFAYVVSSKYFNPKIFEYEQLNHQNRTRNKKRKNYELFLEYVKDFKLSSDFVFGNKEEFVDKAEKFFKTEIRSEIDAWKEVVDQQKRASAKFNGNIIMEEFPLRGRELGQSIKNLKEYLASFMSTNTKEQNDIYFQRWILDNNMETIFRVFKDVNNLN